MSVFQNIPTPLPNQERILPSKRDDTIDVLKGLAILLMIVGHCMPQKTLFGVALHGMIYSFHMPLFFIVGGMFYKGNINIKKDAKRLLLPYLFTGVILLLAKGIESAFINDITPFQTEVIKVLSGSTWYRGTNMYLQNIPSVGAIYFLFALFWCRVVYGLLYYICAGKKLLLGICCIVLSSLAVYNDNYFIHFPWSINAGVSCLFYFFIGHHFASKIVQYKPKWWMIVILLVLWMTLVYFFAPMDMGGCMYKNFYASIVCACLGTYLLYVVACLLSKSVLNKSLATIGIYTLPILCMHCLQRRLLLAPIMSYSFVVQLLVAIVFAFGLTFLLTRIRFTRKIFGIK